MTDHTIPSPSARALELRTAMEGFMRDRVLPAEADYAAHRAADGPDGHTVPPVIERLKAEARELGLWNLFLPSESGLTQLEYAPIAELSGWSNDLGPEAINCQAPDTGNMELLHLLGTEDQKATWLEPLLAGEIRSAFAMTEPDVASSDATNIATRIERDGDDYVINGRKWWTSGAMDPRCSVMIVMGKTDPEAATHRQQSMVIVPRDTPGVTIVRDLPVFGHHDQHGHALVTFEDVRVPVTNVIGEEGGGFAAAQARLGPGRIHHCMRALGAAERALALLVERARSRVAFGAPLADQGVVRQQIAESRLEIEQARLLCYRACQVIDTEGNKAAKDLVAMAKVAVPRAATAVIDRAIQVHGGAGITDVTPLAAMYGWHRAMRLFDGPDEVHLRSIARSELGRTPVLPPGAVVV
ncbi:acyl-CoA dehydrogenase [Nocardioides psychrotolerans]|uniref:Acyl-CoA dehydrogenase n=1 Tax=Nocardioides psychrotolerans TaxID=1005945 RepID=A0A1I3QV75_9ACTN|nr:acyl-CoA dehydrogenase family protein [Nocardioides psychrotolerans]GEP40277.1 acyl-CoA dehydrogenase [Nocardioides psychrotolerans]SFJ38163.1 acyl-CoA dehydrogenase [Nocardioides psychrotolerans]